MGRSLLQGENPIMIATWAFLFFAVAILIFILVGYEQFAGMLDALMGGGDSLIGGGIFG